MKTDRGSLLIEFLFFILLFAVFLGGCLGLQKKLFDQLQSLSVANVGAKLVSSGLVSDRMAQQFLLSAPFPIQVSRYNQTGASRFYDLVLVEVGPQRMVIQRERQ